MKISKLHFIATSPQQAEQACAGGARWIQLRVKNLAPDEWEELARATQQVCQHYAATLILNDNPWLARTIGADGVHLGKEDMPPAEARALLGPGPIIGGTANTFEDVQRLVAVGVEYIGLGPFRFTTTKQNLSPVLGLTGYHEILRQMQAAGITVPVIAIGGIVRADLPELLAAGLHGVAVSGAIANAPEPAAETALFLNQLHPQNLFV
ncbi:thiamine phosphate synthase [Hymenobacter sp. BT186]|uniref:Thiamine-phosphate synthase n=1 Tax=Hymenobacter telluris TaxID=2816474 RepID=A0A939JAE6_9BACT|nr:thiamine phosphate synthase [Hymenobacter telluris]MBO0358016.1 thiamine phosphate synthase [Hymenobacter telluris]MBW3374043.1 thiamine phosphate synthase [Hymenobacter norwichensis]